MKWKNGRSEWKEWVEVKVEEQQKGKENVEEVEER